MLAAGPLPVLSLGGDTSGLRMAAARTDLIPGMQACVDALVAQGHRRIVLICPRWRGPTRRPAAAAFLERLRHHHLASQADYSMPDWDHTPAGLQSLLEALFFATPPTALLVIEPECLGPVLVFLAARGLKVPGRVSVVNVLPDPMQSFSPHSIAHFKWPIQAHVKRILRWVDALSGGREDV
jgi:DNA-binding LacI/PurR family transcriptional regulator